MLSFATEFPARPVSGCDQFVEAIKRWVLESPHTKFDANDLSKFDGRGNYEFRKENLSIRSISIDDGKECSVAFQHIMEEGDISWILEVAFNGNGFDSWVSIRTSREAGSPSEVLPEAKKPVIIRTLLETLGGGIDGHFEVISRPHYLKSDDISRISEIMTGDANCHLPIVYLSIDFQGKYSVDVNAIASDLSGMAHVLVEPDRAFSYKLQSEVASINAYGGMIGIYWPDATGRRSIFRAKNFATRNILKQSIVGAVRQALLNRRPLYECTWGFVQERVARLAYDKLRESGSNNVDEYVEIFDQEQKMKDDRIGGLEKEIQRLKSEIKRYERQSVSAIGLNLRVVTEQEFDEGEFLDIVLDVLNDGSKGLFSGGRKEHIINDIIISNVKTGRIEEKREKVKSLFRGYTSMSKNMRSELERIGFSVTEDGKHYKAVYKDDSRYTFSIAKTGSDHRGGLNMASDIIKK